MCGFFLRSFMEVNGKFPILFEESTGDQGGSAAKNFGKIFGWVYSAKVVSEFEAISLNEVWELPVLQFLNDLTYLKLKREVDEEQYRRIQMDRR